jgi:hypothetical protein
MRSAARQIDAARERLDVMNPYFTYREMIERILAAAREVRTFESSFLRSRTTPSDGRPEAPLRRSARGRRRGRQNFQPPEYSRN